MPGDRRIDSAPLWFEDPLFAPETVRITMTLIMDGALDDVQCGIKVENWDDDNLLELETWNARDWQQAQWTVAERLLVAVESWRERLLPF
jgi:hypothetical protein